MAKKKNDIEREMEAYWISVQAQVETRIKQAWLAGVKFGLTRVRGYDEEMPDAED
jgi:hypothetical protein